MRIDRLGAPANAARSRMRRGGGAFELPGEAGTQTDAAPANEAAPAGGGAAALTSLAELAQAGAAPAAGQSSAVALDAAAARQGDELLKALQGLQLAGLENRFTADAASGHGAGAAPGGATDAARKALADLAQGTGRAADPVLNDLLQAIAARAAVEVARSG